MHAFYIDCISINIKYNPWVVSVPVLHQYILAQEIVSGFWCLIQCSLLRESNRKHWNKMIWNAVFIHYIRSGTCPHNVNRWHIYNHCQRHDHSVEIFTDIGIAFLGVNGSNRHIQNIWQSMQLPDSHILSVPFRQQDFPLIDISNTIFTEPWPWDVHWGILCIVTRQVFGPMSRI